MGLKEKQNTSYSSIHGHDEDQMNQAMVNALRTIKPDYTCITDFATNEESEKIPLQCVAFSKLLPLDQEVIKIFCEQREDAAIEKLILSLRIKDNDIQFFRTIKKFRNELNTVKIELEKARTINLKTQSTTAHQVKENRSEINLSKRICIAYQQKTPSCSSYELVGLAWDREFYPMFKWESNHISIVCDNILKIINPDHRNILDFFEKNYKAGTKEQRVFNMQAHSSNVFDITIDNTGRNIFNGIYNDEVKKELAAMIQFFSAEKNQKNIRIQLMLLPNYIPRTNFYDNEEIERLNETIREKDVTIEQLRTQLIKTEESGQHESLTQLKNKYRNLAYGSLLLNILIVAYLLKLNFFDNYCNITG
jgi:hypothetical protein